MKPLVFALALLSTTAVAAEELYVPVSSATEVEIANPSPRRAFVELELLGGIRKHVALQAGERMQWSAPEAGVLRVSGRVAVTALRRGAHAIASLPVLDSRATVDEAAAPASTASWRGGLLIVNPGDESVVVTVDGTIQTIGPRGVLRGGTFRAESPLLAFACDVNDATGAEVFTAITPHARSAKRRAVRSVTPAPQPQTQTVVLTPSKDNTLFETANGELSNGAGPHMFAGTTQSGGRRRAVVAFDVAGQVPSGSRVTKVTLTMRVSQTISGPEPVTLHRLGKDWGEGTSNAGSSRDGSGTASRTNDATWRHTFFSNQRWTEPGGDFDAATEATASVGGTTGVWESAAMIARVQQWLDTPASNFGWIVVGSESSSATAKRFDSSEASPAFRPALAIEFVR